MNIIIIMFGALFLGIVLTATAAAQHPHRQAIYNHDLLAQCAVQLLNVSSLLRTTVYVTMSSRVTDDFRTLILRSMHRANKPALLLREFDIEQFNPNRYVLPLAYLVAARDVSDLANHLDTINVTDDSWQPTVNFVVLLQESPPADAQYGRPLYPVYRRIWTKFMFHSVLLAPSSAGAIAALAWYPFRGRCGEYHAPKTVDTCGGGGAPDHYRWNASGGDVFQNRIPDAFNACTVTIAAFDWPPMTVLSGSTMVNGMDVEVVKIMSRIGRVRLAVNVIRENRRWGVKSANGSWDGGFGELSAQRADFLIGGGIMTAERMAMFDSAPPRQVIRFPIYTPLPRWLPYWQNMLNVFPGTFWLTLFAVFALTAAVFWASGVHLPRSERRAFADPGHCLAVSWAVLCSVASGRQPASVPSKVAYLSWAVYVLHVSAVYTSMQLIYLYKPKYERPMRTIGDVKASGLAVCCVPTFIPIARAMAPENFNLTGYTPCTDMRESADRLLRRKDVIILDPEDHFETLVGGSVKKVNKADDVVIVHNIGVYMQKGNPYKGILARAQIAAYEAGLHKKWREDASPPSARPRHKDKQNIKVKKLNVDELQGAFIILACGHCASLIAFVCERLFSPRSRPFLQQIRAR